jgi:hypothetical protein
MISRMRWRVRTQETGVNGHPDGTMAFTRESAAWHSDRKLTPSSISACTSLPRDLGFRWNATARDRAQRARNFGRAAPGNGVIARCPDPPSQPRTAEFRALYRDSARQAGRGGSWRTRPCDLIRVQRFRVGQVGRADNAMAPSNSDSTFTVTAPAFDTRCRACAPGCHSAAQGRRGA